MLKCGEYRPGNILAARTASLISPDRFMSQAITICINSHYCTEKEKMLKLNNKMFLYGNKGLLWVYK